MSQHSNVDAIAAQLARLADGLGFTSKGSESPSVGADILTHVGTRISDHAHAEQCPDGVRRAGR
jgi:hypothetical protein